MSIFMERERHRKRACFHGEGEAPGSVNGEGVFSWCKMVEKFFKIFSKNTRVAYPALPLEGLIKKTYTLV
jgi:hypothetical protein